MRATGTENTLLDLTSAGNFEQKPATGVVDLLSDSVLWTNNSIENPALTHNSETNGMEIFVCGSATHSLSGTWYLTAWRNGNGPAKRVAQGTCTTGTQAVVKWPHNSVAVANTFWCDQIVVTWSNWPKGVEATDASGNSNSVGSLWFDACGYRYWLLEFRQLGVSPIVNLTAFYGRF